MLKAFSVSTLPIGGDVTCVDLVEQNITLGNILAKENPNLKIKFIKAKIEEFVATIQDGEYDLVLMLSVLHNISKYLGVEFVQNMVAYLSKKIHTGLFEFALERVHRNYIPNDYNDFLPGFDFIKLLSYSNHRDGSGVKRPLCFASNKYAYFEDLGILSIDKISYNTHSYLAKTDLIHYHCGNKFVKFFYVKNQNQLIKVDDEINFLKVFDGQNGLPKIHNVYIEQNEIGARIFIVRDKINGVTLAEKIASDENFDRWMVIKQSLEWMVFFEERGYYHGDIQTSNFIFGDDGKIYPIDYEEIRKVPIVLIWPFKPILLFFIFMNSVLEPNNRPFAFHRQPQLLTKLKNHIPHKKYEQILKIKESEKYFARLYEILFKTKSEENSVESYILAELEILAIEKYLEEIGQTLKVYRDNFSQFNNLANLVLQQQKKIEQLENILKSKI